MTPCGKLAVAALVLGAGVAGPSTAWGLAADKPQCRLSTSEIDGYRGQMELREGTGGQRLTGYLAYRFPDSAVTLSYMEFAPSVPMKLGLMVDFSLPAKESDRALALLGQDGVSDLRVFVGRLTGNSADTAHNKGADILKTYQLGLGVTGAGTDTYEPVPQSRLGADLYSFGGGDIGTARAIVRPLLGEGSGAGGRSVSVNLLAGLAKLEAKANVTGYRVAATRLFGAAAALRERASKGQCAVLKGA